MPKNCTAILKSGKRKGQLCNAHVKSEGSLCVRHKCSRKKTLPKAQPHTKPHVKSHVKSSQIKTRVKDQLEKAKDALASNAYLAHVKQLEQDAKERRKKLFARIKVAKELAKQRDITASAARLLLSAHNDDLKKVNRLIDNKELIDFISSSTLKYTRNEIIDLLEKHDYKGEKVLTIVM